MADPDTPALDSAEPVVRTALIHFEGVLMYDGVPIFGGPRVITQLVDNVIEGELADG